MLGINTRFTRLPVHNRVVIYNVEFLTTLPRAFWYSDFITRIMSICDTTRLYVRRRIDRLNPHPNNMRFTLARATAKVSALRARIFSSCTRFTADERITIFYRTGKRKTVVTRKHFPSTISLPYIARTGNIKYV